jgi:hypothetical protein
VVEKNVALCCWFSLFSPSDDDSPQVLYCSLWSFAVVALVVDMSNLSAKTDLAEDVQEVNERHFA